MVIQGFRIRIFPTSRIPDPAVLQHSKNLFGFANLIGEMVLDVLDGLLAGQPVPGDDGGGVDLLLN